MAPTTCGILVPQPGIKLASLQWKHGILTTGPMMLIILQNILCSCSSCHTRCCISTQSLVITCMHHTACDRHVLSHLLFLFLATSYSPTKTLFSWHFLQEGPRLGDIFISYRHNFGKVTGLYPLYINCPCISATPDRTISCLKSKLYMCIC